MKGTFYLHRKATYYRECVTCHVILSPEYFNTVTKYLNITIFTWTISKFCYAGKYHFSDYLISFTTAMATISNKIPQGKPKSTYWWICVLLLHLECIPAIYIYVYIYGLYKVLRLFWLCILCILEPHTANGHFYQFGVGSLNLAMYFTVSSSMLTFKYIIVCNVTKITQLF